MQNSNIEWCDHTFNAWEGCTKIGPGCDNCYAAVRNNRFHEGQHWGAGAARLLRSDSYWNEPLKWQRNHAQFLATHGRRQRVFCSSLADVFDKESPKGQRERLWELIRITPDLDWLLLTKRVGNILKMLPAEWGSGYPNVWLGITVVNQEEFDRDFPKLLRLSATVRWLSMEPLLGAIELPSGINEIDWIVVGGESGAGSRSMRFKWACSLRDQCRAAGVPFLFKQWGDWAPARAGMHFQPLHDGPQFIARVCGRDTVAFPDEFGYGAVRIGKKAAGRLLEAQQWDQYPKAAAK